MLSSCKVLLVVSVLVIASAIYNIIKLSSTTSAAESFALVNYVNPTNYQAINMNTYYNKYPLLYSPYYKCFPSYALKPTTVFADTTKWKNTVPTTSSIYLRNPFSQAYLSLNGTQLVYTNIWKNATLFNWTIYGDYNNIQQQGSLSNSSGDPIAINDYESPFPLLYSSASGYDYGANVFFTYTVDYLFNQEGLKITMMNVEFNVKFLGPPDVLASSVPFVCRPISENTAVQPYDSLDQLNQNNPFFFFEWLDKANAPPQI